MQTKVIILVADKDDDKHGEISVLDDAKKAEQLVETLLEAGFEEERIRVFKGDELDMQITHRPMVTLVQAEAEAEAEAQDSDEEEQEEGQAEAKAGEKASSDQSEAKIVSSFRGDFD
ncbi:MAG: hypothetical protein ACE5KW_01640 [Dehalococcoidia bacterium]